MTRMKKNELLLEKLKELEVQKDGLQESLGISKSNIITSFEESNQIFISSFWVWMFNGIMFNQLLSNFLKHLQI